jgi:tRNA-2-methylthio-N6-dimethylallyladenosine synthase
VSRAAPHYLIADGAPIAVRRTSGGDSWQARADGAVLADQGSVGRGSTQAGGTQAGGAGQPVLLGMPALGAPAPGQRS